MGSGGVPAGLSKAVCGICRVFAGLQLGSSWAPRGLLVFYRILCVEGLPTKHRAANRKDSWYFTVFFMC